MHAARIAARRTVRPPTGRRTHAGRAAGLVLVAAAGWLALAAPAAAQMSGGDSTAGASAVCDVAETTDDGVDIGTAQTVAGAEVTVTDAEFEPKVQDFFDEGYLRVSFTIRNPTDAPVSYEGRWNWKLLDLTSGEELPTPLDSAASLNEVQIDPGKSLEGHVTFTVGFAGGDYRIRYEAGGVLGSDDLGTWKVAVDDHDGGAPPPELSVPVTTSGFENVPSYEIDVTIEKDGSAVFREEIRYDFDDLERHGIYRDLIVRQRCNDRYDRVYPLDVLSVSSPTGAPADYVVETAETGTNPFDGAAVKRIKIGDADKTVTGRHTYLVEYRLEGVLNAFEDRDELYWNVVGDRWGVQLADVLVVVHTPGGAQQVACFAGETGSRAPCTKAVIKDGTARFRQRVLTPYQGMSVVVGFPKGQVPEPEPILDERWSLTRAFALTPVTVGGAVGGSLFVIAAFGVVAFRVGRDRQAMGSVVDQAFAPADVEGEAVGLFDDQSNPVEFAPPDELRPAQYSLIMHERVSPTDITATIVDLAVRGYLRIEEHGEGRKKDYGLVKTGDDRAGLLPYEQRVMSGLFNGREATSLSSLKYAFADDMAAITEAIYADAMGRKWFHRRPDKVRAGWMAMGILVVLLGLGLVVALALFTTVALLGIPLAVLGLMMIRTAGAMPRRTPVGTGLVRRSRGFEIFMEDSEAPRARWSEKRNIFSEYLPYAIVLGIADRWADTFEPLGAEAVAGASTWYVGSRPFTPSYLVTSTSTFSSTARSTLGATVSTSGSSGSSGFSGGGSSGGGGGGGGGGSW